MSDVALRANPYVGLRPFSERDSLYFFGRGPQVADLLEILHRERFLGVVGSSGSGKSSLIRAALLPKLLGGFLARDCDRWRIVRARPGDTPIGNLASALLGAGGALTQDGRADLERRIRDDHTAAVVAHLQATGEPDANVFVLIDQFEEIFAFRGPQEGDAEPAGDAARWQERARRRAEAADFVDLLLGLSQQSAPTIYVALAMRTDFLGECDVFYGLPEALNRGRYLVPRLARQQLREAIEGPAALVGARLEPRLVDHLLNALGDRFDRLPVLQHTLQRTWDAWSTAGGVGAIDFPHYEAAGRLDRALDRDAEAALQGLEPALTAAVFKQLTDTDVRERRVRSPARLSRLVAASGADRAAVDDVVRRFEEGGRNFLYRSDDGHSDDPRIDIAHESLIRQWDRLRGWVDEERQSRDWYRELVGRARKAERGEAALLQGPELRVMAEWRDRMKPTPAWAERYAATGDDFARASGYLDASLAAHCHTLAEAELARRWKIWNPLLLLAVLLVALLVEQQSGEPSVRLDGRPRDAQGRAEVSPAAAIETARIGELEWAADDRGKNVDWAAAQAYCDRLTTGPRDDWRLPSMTELFDLYDAQASQSPGPGGPFQKGATPRWVWTSEPGAPANTAIAGDFREAVFVPVPAGFSGGAAICVAEPATLGRAEDFERKQRSALAAVRAYLPLGVFVLVYLVLAWVGRRLHRRFAFDRILQRVVASGGRRPDDDAASAANAPDAVTAHATTYASTGRRAYGYILDAALHVAALFVLLVVIAIVEPAPVVVTMPDGEVVRGVFEDSDDHTVTITTDAGETRSFPVSEGPRVTLVGGAPVIATLPTGEQAEGFSFMKPQLLVTLPSGEQVEGTPEESSDASGDTLVITTADGSRRSFTVDLEKPQVDISWPPSDTGFVWLLVGGLVFGWLYDALLLSSMGQATLGMRAAGIFRTGLRGERLSFGRASAWYGYRLLSYLAYLLGFLVQPFTKRRQTFHDWMAGAVVLRRPPANPSPR